MDFDTWLNQVPEKKPTKVELNSRREIVTQMTEDLNRMLSDHDAVHPSDLSSLGDISGISAKRDNKYLEGPKILYNNNMYEQEWELYKGGAIDED